MIDDTFYLVPRYYGRTNTYFVRHKDGKYELWQNEWGGQPKKYLGEANDMLIALAKKANLPQ